MRRLPLVSFTALAVATVGAFFVTQHLKVTTPLLAGTPRPVPNVINPHGGVTCNGVDHSRMKISFYLLNRADDVDVYVVDSGGTIVRTLATGRHMAIKRRSLFTWNGREDNGSVAPDGTYYLRVALVHQGRTVDITDTTGHLETITVKTAPPRPVVTSVSPSLIPLDHTPVAIRYKGTEGNGVVVVLYRTDLPGDPIVKTFQAGPSEAFWNGLIRERPAPPGTYLVGLRVTDAACNTGRFPARVPPSPETTSHAGVTVRYLAAQPPLTPVAAGGTAVVYVDARGRPYQWTLWRVGARKPSGHGSGQRHELRVKLPTGQGAGLYHLAITSGRHRTDVPLLASLPSARHAPRILVVLPALTWQGQNPVDDPPDQDGIPNTLDAGGPIELDRVLANGLPRGFADEAAFLAYLDRVHLGYDLTSDLGLIDGVGPSLAGHAGVVLAGSERWIPASLGSALRSYVEGGGRVLSLGTDALRRRVTIHGTSAVHPIPPASTDVLSARPGALVTGNTGPIVVSEDGLGIFAGTSGALRGYRVFEPIGVVSPARLLSAAGTANSAPAIVGYELGRGAVIDIGVVGFGSSLAHSVDARKLVARVWAVLGR